MSPIVEDARQLLMDVDLYQVPINPIAICDKLDIAYDEKPYQGFDGTLVITSNDQLIGVSSTIRERSRKNFTCAHELGHYQYDISSSATQKFICSKNDTGYGGQQLQQKEIRANAFASELLMPKEFVLTEIANKKPSWQLIETLANKFETSLQAAATRFIYLTFYTCWLVVIKDGKPLRFVKNNSNEFLVNLNNFIKIKNMTVNDWATGSATIWLHETRRTKNKELLFWPLLKNQYGETLVLLWDKNDSLLNEEIEEDDYRDFSGSGQWQW